MKRRLLDIDAAVAKNQTLPHLVLQVQAVRPEGNFADMGFGLLYKPYAVIDIKEID